MNDSYMMLKDVRCSFPQLWHDDEKSFNGETTVYPKGVTLLLSKAEHPEIIKAVQARIKEVALSNPGIKKMVVAAKGYHSLKGICLRGEGEDGWREEYPSDHMILKAGMQKGAKPPLVLHANGKKAIESEDPIYSGCRVNVKVDIWAQNNNWGKRINCKLIAIQFAGEGVALDASFVSEDVAKEGFDALPGSDDLDSPTDTDFGDSTSDTDFLNA